ncbi:hypothetical protein HY489_00925 [Candidatus Woesearchaeota archaeon]|nr:hypothetical protein [Candidatus Woesearchaeota archaeon]
MALYELIQKAGKRILVPLTLAAALTGCPVTERRDDGDPYMSAGGYTTMPRARSPPDNSDYNPARDRQQGVRFGNQGYMPDEDRDFSSGMSQRDYERYGGHR